MEGIDKGGKGKKQSDVRKGMKEGREGKEGREEVKEGSKGGRRRGGGRERERNRDGGRGREKRNKEGGRENQQATKRDTRDRGKEEGQCITRCESDCFKYYYQGIMGISPRCPELNARAKSSSCCRRCVYRSHHARWFQFTVPPLC
jgi:hypothetical protein